MSAQGKNGLYNKASQSSPCNSFWGSCIGNWCCFCLTVAGARLWCMSRGLLLIRYAVSSVFEQPQAPHPPLAVVLICVGVVRRLCLCDVNSHLCLALWFGVAGTTALWCKCSSVCGFCVLKLKGFQFSVLCASLTVSSASPICLHSSLLAGFGLCYCGIIFSGELHAEVLRRSLRLAS